MSTTSTISWPDDWDINPDNFESEDELESALIAKFQESRQLYQSFAQHWHDLPYLLTLMITHSWYADSEISITDLRDLESNAINGDFASIQDYLIDYFRNKADDIQRRVCERYPHRTEIVAEAFVAHGEGRYVLAIPVFLAQADGISEELFGEHFFIYGQFGDTVKKVLRNGQLTDYGRLLLDPLVQRGKIREHTNTLLNQTDYLNRHAILHGMDLNYATEKNALKSISLLAYFLLAQTLNG